MQPNRVQPPPSAASVFQQQSFGSSQGQFGGGGFQNTSFHGQPGGQPQHHGQPPSQGLPGQQQFASGASFAANPYGAPPQNMGSFSQPQQSQPQQQQPSFGNFSAPVSSQPANMGSFSSAATPPPQAMSPPSGGFGVYGQVPQQQPQSSFAFSPSGGSAGSYGQQQGFFAQQQQQPKQPTYGSAAPQQQQPSFGSMPQQPAQPQSSFGSFQSAQPMSLQNQPSFGSAQHQSQPTFGAFQSASQPQQQPQQFAAFQGSIQQQAPALQKQTSFGGFQSSQPSFPATFQQQPSQPPLQSMASSSAVSQQPQQPTFGNFGSQQFQPQPQQQFQQQQSFGASMGGGATQPAFGSFPTAAQPKPSAVAPLSGGTTLPSQQSFSNFQTAPQPQAAPASGGSFNIFQKVQQPVVAAATIAPVAEDPRMLQAIAESKNPDVIALRALLNSDKEKARVMLEEKKQAVEKWTGVCDDLRKKKTALLDSIAEAKTENAKLKEELASVRSMYKAEREALSLIAREEMRLEHAAALAMLRDVSQEGDKAARPENIASMSALLAAALEKLRAAAAAGEPVDPELMDVVRLLKSYLSFVRGIAYNASDQELAARAVEAAALAAAVEQFEAVFSDASPQNVDRLIQVIRSGMGQVEQVCKLLEEKDEKLEAMEDGKLQDAAEQQLREAALRIEQAAKQISAIRMAPRSQDFGLGALKVCDALLAATEDLALITGRLVMHATLAQKERKAQELNAGTGEEMREQYRQNQTWVNGLISAAQAAAYRISLLVQIANRVMQKQQSWEYIIAGSEEVQMAGVQLVTAARAKLDSFSPNNRNLQTTQQELSASVKKLITTANEFHEEVEPPPVRTEELSANKANTAVYQHKSDVEALEVALKREQMQLLELLTQASGGRTEDLTFKNNAAAEVVNRSDDAPAPPASGFGQPSPRKLTNPFAVPSAAMFDAPKAAAPVIKTPLFGGAVAPAPKSSPAAAPFAPVAAPVKQAAPSPAPAPAPAVPSAAMFEMPKATPPVAMKKVPPGPKAALATSPVQQQAGSPQLPPPPVVSSPPSGVGATPAAPAKFNPFAAVKTGAAVKRGAVPPPPPAGGAPPGGGRPMPPPPK